jgi:hypothetical protein
MSGSNPRRDCPTPRQVGGTALVAQAKATVGDGESKITQIRPVPVFMITRSGAVIVHKDTLPIVRCTRVAAPLRGPGTARGR